MNCGRNTSSLSVLFAALLLLSSFGVLTAQNNNSNNSNNNNNSNSNSNNSSSTNNNNNNNSYNQGGVFVDAKGLLQRDVTLDYGQLSQQQLAAARSAYSAVPKDVTAKSLLRFVSLNRLEKAAVDANGVVSEEMKYLAGLYRIQYVFYFPESKDIVVAGPAEGWFPGYEGAMVGRTTFRPTCELQDLVAALRVYAPNTEGADVVGCSIDPTEEGNVRMKQFLQGFNGNISREDGRAAFRQGLRESLGNQTIRVDGIPAATHAAQIMIAADYRMKRIGIGVDTPPVRIETFIDKVNPRRASENALYRWFFVPDYESVVLTEDRTGLELIGEGVKLVVEDELVSATTGERTAQAGQADPASIAFARSFTKNYPLLAKRSLVFAQLRNFIDMLVCAAHIQQQGFYGKSGWSMTFFGDESKYAVQTVNVPKEVEPVVGSKAGRSAGQTVYTAPIGGGVLIEPETALEANHAKIEANGKIAALQKNVKIDLPAGVWWWDAK